MNKNEWLIGEKNHNQRLDNFLLYLLKDRTKSYIYKLVRQGQVRVNKSRAKAMQKVKLGDVIRLPPFLIDEMQATADKSTSAHIPNIPKKSLETVYEDSHYLIINKPYGLPVHSGSGHDFGIIDMLRQNTDYSYLELVHRLDKDTSGCLMLAKSRDALVAMQELLSEKLNTGKNQQKKNQYVLKKDYLALLHGKLHQATQKTDFLLKNTLAQGERVTSVDMENNAASSAEDKSKAKQAVSVFTPEQHFIDEDLGIMTLASVRIYTGRTHQIRVQSQEMEHPIAGDKKYGDRDLNKQLQRLGLKRMFLHAHKLSFLHPMTKMEIAVTAPLDDELNNILAYLSAD